MKSLRELFSELSEEAITKLPIEHPLRRGDLELDRAVTTVSARGLKTWLAKNKSRILDLQSVENVSAMAIEIRAYADLLDARFKVTPLDKHKGKVSPDFAIDAGDGPVVVEVFAKHATEDDGGELEETWEWRGERWRGRTEVSVVHPAGAPDPEKPNDTTQANFISRVCAVKGTEHQIDEEKASILWIDFRKFGPWPEVLDADEANPLNYWREGITSGGLWYAFYGWKGAPIFQEDFFPMEHVVPMGHDGRFALGGKRSKLSAVVLSLSNKCMVFENPEAMTTLPLLARRYLLNLPRFDLGRSIMEWTPGWTRRAIELRREQIISLEKIGTDLSSL